MHMTDKQNEWLKALIDEAAMMIGPIARLLVERAAADATSFDEIRRQVAEQMDEATRRRFLHATGALAAKAAPDFAPPSTFDPARSAAMPVLGTTATLDRSDPAFVRELVRDLVARLGPDAEATVLEAARRCRTKMQLCLRLANAVRDPDSKAYLSQRALGFAKLRPA